MNSSQRRKLKREYPFTAVFELGVHDPSSFDESIKVMNKWCKKNCKHEWRSFHYWYHAKYKFNSSKDAMMFKLRWL